MNGHLPNPREIEKWVPRHLDEVIGCNDLRVHLRDCLRLDGEGSNTLVTGPTGSGKTACVKAYLRSLMCPSRNPDTQVPCLSCSGCNSFDVRYREEGLFACNQTRATNKGEPINYYPINCGKITEATLREVLDALERFDGRSIVYLDEVHRLVNRHLQHMLLVPIRENDAIWIASTAHPENLDKMFIGRFTVREVTQKPSKDEFVKFLIHRCRVWQVAVDPDAMPLLVRRVQECVSEAIGCIARAAGKRDRRLTRDLVNKHFD